MVNTYERRSVDREPAIAASGIRKFISHSDIVISHAKSKTNARMLAETDVFNEISSFVM